MKYIIMCGGNYSFLKQLTKVKNETLVERTIRLLREHGVTDIYISTNHDEFDRFGVPLIRSNVIERKRWIDGAFPVLDEPVCYIFGDVLFSSDAIRVIIETETDDVEFFASAPPFDPEYDKHHAEPFAFKVVNFKHFAEAIDQTRDLFDAGELRRCISWELWQVIKGTPLNKIDYTNYTVIRDYTCDIDTIEQAQWLETRIKNYQFLLNED